MGWLRKTLFIQPRADMFSKNAKIIGAALHVVEYFAPVYRHISVHENVPKSRHRFNAFREDGWQYADFAQ